MCRKFRNVPIFKNFPPICPYFLVFRVGRYEFYDKYVLLFLVRAAKEKRLRLWKDYTPSTTTVDIGEKTFSGKVI